MIVTRDGFETIHYVALTLIASMAYLSDTPHKCILGDGHFEITGLHLPTEPGMAFAAIGSDADHLEIAVDGHLRTERRLATMVNTILGMYAGDEPLRVVSLCWETRFQVKDDQGESTLSGEDLFRYLMDRIDLPHHQEFTLYVPLTPAQLSLRQKAFSGLS